MADCVQVIMFYYLTKQNRTYVPLRDDAVHLIGDLYHSVYDDERHVLLLRTTAMSCNFYLSHASYILTSYMENASRSYH